MQLDDKGLAGSRRYTRPSRYVAQQAGSYDQPDPQDLGRTGAEKRIAALQRLEDEARSGYSPSDFVKQVYGFPGKLYDEADQGVRGLIDLTGGLFRGEVDPGLAAEDMARGTLDSFKNTVLHPVTQANENPLEFIGNVTAVGALGGAALRSGAARFGAASPAEWFSDETGAIGRIGGRLERGEATDFQTASPGIIPSNEFTATQPNLGVATFPDETALGIVKANRPPFQANGVTFHPMAQAEAEAAASELSAAVPSELRVPGVQYGEWEHIPRVMDRNLTSPGTNWRFDTPRTDPGALIEYLDDLREIQGPEDIAWTPENQAYFRQQNIFDQFVGNNDRALGLNQFAVGDQPITMDNGAAFQTGGSVDTMYTPQAWTGGIGLGGPEMDYLGRLTEWLDSMRRRGFDPGSGLAQIPGGQIRSAIDRGRRMLESGQYTTPMWQPRAW